MYANATQHALEPLLEPYLSSGTLPKGTLVTGEMSGWFNRNYFLKKPSGERVVLRSPKGEAETKPGREYVGKEFRALGLSDTDWGFHSIPEQIERSEEWASKGIPVLVPVAASPAGDSLLNPYLDEKGAPYEDVLSGKKGASPNEALLATRKFFEGIGSSHAKGVVMGDRWGPNEFVLPGGGITFFDFDLRLDDPDFEAAQAIYYTLRYSARLGDPFIREIARDAKRLSGQGDERRVLDFLERHGEYFGNWHPWGSRERETGLIIDSMKKVH